MADVVGNPEDRFSHNEAQMISCLDCERGIHYANMSVQYTAIFHGCKNDNFQMKMLDIFLISAQKIDCGYTLEPPQ